MISCGPSNENFAGAGLYSAFFFNKCALVKFDVTSTSTSATCLTGLNNKVTVNFANNGVAYGQEGNGLIKLSGGDGEKWAILLPQAAMEVGEEGSVYSEDGNCTGTRSAIPAITENGYLTDGITVTLQGGSTPNVPEGSINGLFSVSDSTQVYFSQGNLQYIGSAATPYWKFADNQWDYFGTTTGQNSSDQNVDRDLFGWGTSGYNHNNSCYQPWSTDNHYYNYYAYGAYFAWLYNSSSGNYWGYSGNADWGYNPIVNGGNQENSGWRTLTGNEWNHLLFVRETPSGIRFAPAKVNNTNGFIILPDNWDSNIYPLQHTNLGGYGINNITANNWTDVFEINGAVFLPTAGYRNETSISYAGDYGYYWSASVYQFNGSYKVAHTLIFQNSVPFITGITGNTGFERNNGASVRLVRNAE